MKRLFLLLVLLAWLPGAFSARAQEVQFDSTSIAPRERPINDYIMVGVNELGGSIGGIAGNIEKLKNMVMTLCPDCKIFLEGNLHFTTAAEANYRAQKKTYMTNDRINQVNARMAAMADWKTVFYFDINEHFDIDGGSFNPAFSGDGVHPTSTYYREWADWIYTRGILD